MEKMDGMTMNIEQANVEKLKEVFPEVFADGKVDFDKLQGLLGHYIADDKEKYSFSWKGKADSLRLAQKRSTGTLRPCKEESKNWDTTENLYIEGDNLEVLKLLQSSYLNSVKMIYIDPPYNTGNDFVYTDDFADGIAHYKEVTGQANKSNPETAGRYHTNWLNMMYPRLKLARNLLTDDGVIFISIDDNEQANLKKLCDEVFGEDNFVGKWNWYKSETPPNLSYKIKKNIEYIYAYEKHKDSVKYKGEKKNSPSNDPLTKPQNSIKKLVFPVGTISTKLKDGIIKKGTYGTDKFPNTLLFDLEIRDGRNVNEACFENKFIWTQKTLQENIDSGVEIYLSENLVLSYKRKNYDNEVPPNFISAKQGSTIEESGKRLAELFGVSVFDYPKPTELLKYLLRFKDDSDSIILDFFSGSATTAHAVMQLNVEDGGKRKFICVQLPEKTDEQSEAYKAGYKTICEIGKERIRRAGTLLERNFIENDKILSHKKATKNPMHDFNIAWEKFCAIDTGFKVFKLDSSNLVKWDNTPTTDEEEVKKRIQQSIFYLVEGRSDLDLVYEIMLKNGLSLTLPVEERKFNGVKAYIINHPDYKVLVCLQPNITLSAVEEMDKETIGTYIFADRCFADANILSNTEEILKKKDKEMRLF